MSRAHVEDVGRSHMHQRCIDFVAASSVGTSASSIETEQHDPESKRRRTTGVSRPLEHYVRMGCFEVLVADPRPTDVFSQSLTFDVATHDHMQADGARCAAFADAISEHARGKIVLEIGTGPSALLAVLAARSGAKRVYAVEGDAAAASAAKQHVEQLVQAGSVPAGCILILHKFSTQLSSADLPEPIDLVVHELLGTFASSEGVRHFLGAARPRVLRAPGACVSIPHRSATMLAPGIAPGRDLLRRVPSRHTAIGPGQKYLIVGRAGALPPELLMATALPFEDLFFNAPPEHEHAPRDDEIAPGERREGGDGTSGGATCGASGDATGGASGDATGGASGDAAGGATGGATVVGSSSCCRVGFGTECTREEHPLWFTADRDGLVEGFYIWLRFQAAAGHGWVDSFSGSRDGQSTSWAVLFVPLGAAAVAVRTGERLCATCTVLGGGTRTPAYAFRFDGPGGAEGPSVRPLHTVALSLGELYPLNGGSWCRACAGTTASVAEEQSAWHYCAGCGDAYHRRCCSADVASVGQQHEGERRPGRQAPGGSLAAAVAWRCRTCV